MSDLIGLELVGHDAALEMAAQNNPVVSLNDMQAMTQRIAQREAAELLDWFSEDEPQQS